MVFLISFQSFLSSSVAQVFKSSITQHFYSITSGTVTYADALQQSAAATYASVNGHLFVPNSYLELYDVQTYIVAPIHNDPHWFGITDATTEGKWIVSAGPNAGADLSDLLIWGQIEPDGGNQQNCAVHYPGYVWAADVPCASQYKYVIEFECPFGKRFNDAGTACIGTLVCFLSIASVSSCDLFLCRCQPRVQQCLRGRKLAASAPQVLHKSSVASGEGRSAWDG